MDRAVIGLWWETLREVMRPTRAVPIAVLAVPLVLTQHQFSHDRVLADLISAVLVIGFVVLGPFSWRLLRDRAPWAFPVVGLFPFGIGFLMSTLTESGATYLLSSTTGVLSAALFLVGGWGLGRDIELATGLQRAQERADALERSVRSTQLLAMHAHLDPHFLFNTLNAIAEWCVVDGERAEAAILDLSAVLRRLTDGIEHSTWPLADELTLARQVLELHRARDPERITIELPEVVPATEVPPLLLLPLVENAVKHGPARGHRGAIRLEVGAGPRPEIRVSNPGPFAGERDGGRGLGLVRDRLALCWGDRAGLAIEEHGGRTEVRVWWPHG